MVALNVQCSMFNGELSLQLPASRTAALVDTLASATLGDVLLARCSDNSPWHNTLLLPFLIRFKGFNFTRNTPHT